MKRDRRSQEMTPVYEVRTKHTKKVLNDFIAFREAITHSHVTFRLIMLGICSVTLSYLGRDIKGIMYTCGVLAVVFLVFAAVRRPIGVSRLASADKNYQNQSEIHFIFGESEFRVENEDAEGIQRFKYGEVEYMYTDDTYFFINANNEDLQMIPKADFSLGTADGFYDFMMHKTGRDFLPVKLSWRMKLGILKDAWGQMEEERDAKKKR